MLNYALGLDMGQMGLSRVSGARLLTRVKMTASKVVSHKGNAKGQVFKLSGFSFHKPESRIPVFQFRLLCDDPDADHLSAEFSRFDKDLIDQQPTKTLPPALR